MSNEAKHTPGPWKVADELPSIVEDSSHNPRTIAGCGNAVPKSEMEANAHLIAAAPELLKEHEEDDALIMQIATVILNDKIQDYIPFGLRETVKERLRRGTPAIAKAEGRV
jgi:hypothetical protein